MTWLGHSTVTLDLPDHGARLVTDPLLGSRAGLLQRAAPAPDPAAWRGADAALLSHLHHDHAELASLRRLGTVPVITTPENAGWLRQRGLAGVTPDEGGWLTVAGSVQVRLVRADHGHRPMPHRPNGACGHLVRSADLRVWVAGDTGLYPEMAEIPDQAGGLIDLAVVPVWGWGPRLSAGHLDPRQAAEACALVGARHALAVHWGTLHPPFSRGSWFARPGPDFAAAAAELAPACRVLAPVLGRTQEVR